MLKTLQLNRASRERVKKPVGHLLRGKARDLGPKKTQKGAKGALGKVTAQRRPGLPLRQRGGHGRSFRSSRPKNRNGGGRRFDGKLAQSLLIKRGVTSRPCKDGEVRGTVSSLRNWGKGDHS